jgi:TolB protein
MKTEDRLRTSLSRAAGAVAPPEEEGWQAVMKRLQRGEGQSGHRIVAAILALTVAAAGIGFAAWAFGRNVRRPTTVIIPGRIAFVAAGTKIEPGVDNLDIYTLQPGGGGLRNLTDDAASEQGVVWSADGSTAAFIRHTTNTVSRALQAGLYVMRSDGSGLRRVLGCLADGCDFSDYALSPDGKQLAFVRQRGGPGYSLEVIRTDGTGDRTIPCGRCGNVGVSHLAWSPDGTRIAFDGNPVARLGIGPFPSPIYVADTDAGAAEQLTNLRCHPDGGPCTTDVSPVWSPDGSQIAFARDTRSGTGLRHDVVLIAPDGTGEKTILSCGQPACYGPDAPVWSPDGSRLAFSNVIQGSLGEIWVIGADGKVLTKIRPCVGGTCLRADEVTWSPDGRSLAFIGGQPERPGSDLYLVQSDGAGLHRMAEGVHCCVAWLPATRAQSTLPPAAAQTPSAAPSTSPYPPGFVAFASDGGTGDEPQTGIYAIRPDGNGNVSDLTEGSHSDAHPTWSPGGQHIAFDRLTTPARRDIFVMNAHGGDVRRLTTSPGGAVQPAWSPDGHSIAYVGYGQSGQGAVFVMNADGADVRQLTKWSEFPSDPAWSPDGRWLVFDQHDDLYLTHPDGSGLRRLTRFSGGESKPAWSPDGQMIVFVWTTRAGNDLYLIGPEGNGLRRLTNLPGTQDSPAWSPDGRDIAFVHSEGSFFTWVEVVTLDGVVGVPITPSGWAVYDPAWQPAG